jgi:hypothetical protein
MARRRVQVTRRRKVSTASSYLVSAILCVDILLFEVPYANYGLVFI